MIKAILYDLDGVLVDACEWHYLALNKALKEILNIEISRHDHEVKYNGLPTSAKLNMLGLSDSEAQSVWKRKQDLTEISIKTHATLDEKKIFLHREINKRGIKIACVTNAIRSSAELMLSKTGQLSFMEFIISNEDVQNNKPHPDCYLLAISKLGFDAKDVLIVEDSEKGKKAAYASGARVLEVGSASDVTFERLRDYL